MKKETRKKLREFLKSDQARYDDLTRRLERRIELGKKAEARREAS